LAAGVRLAFTALLLNWCWLCLSSAELGWWMEGSNDLDKFLELAERLAFDFEELLVPKDKL
jgi:hypothetical protein